MKHALLVLCFCATACGGSSPTTPTPVAPAAPTRIVSLSGPLAFGDVAVGTSKVMTLTVSNTGNTSFAITGALGSPFAGLTLASLTGTIAAGGSMPLVFTFAPSVVGPQNTTFTLTGDFTSGAASTSITANGVAGAPPSAAGTWTGRATASACRQSGPLAGVDYCKDNAKIGGPMTMAFAQSVTGAVTGTAMFIDYKANVSGSLNGNRLQVNGTGNAGFLDYEYANWNALITGNSMTGAFIFRFSAKNPGGFVEWDMTISNMVRN